MGRKNFNSFYYILQAFKKAYNDDNTLICYWPEYNKRIKHYIRLQKKNYN